MDQPYENETGKQPSEGMDPETEKTSYPPDGDAFSAHNEEKTQENEYRVNEGVGRREGLYTNPDASAEYVFSEGEKKPKPEPPKKKSEYVVIPRKRFTAIAALCVVCTILLSSIAAVLIALTLGGGAKDTGTKEVVLKEITVSADTPSDTPEVGTKMSIADVVTAVASSVVEINTSGTTVNYYGIPKAVSGAGSGVIVAEYLVDGARKGYYVITNAHVVTDETTGALMSTVSIILRDSTVYPNVTVIDYDTESDLAILRFEETKALTVATLGNSDALVVGQETIAIGNPLGTLGGSVTNGIISALDREIEIDGNVMNLMQTNAAINPGNSGGGLFDDRGLLIGIVDAKESGTGIEGLGFAIPVNDAKKFITDIEQYGYVRGRPFLGIATALVQSSYTNPFAIPGVYVMELTAGYNDGENGLAIGDRIISFNGVEITQPTDIKTVLDTLEIGADVSMTVIRSGKQRNVTVHVYEKNNANSSRVDYEG